MKYDPTDLAAEIKSFIKRPLHHNTLYSHIIHPLDYIIPPRKYPNSIINFTPSLSKFEEAISIYTSYVCHLLPANPNKPSVREQISESYCDIDGPDETEVINGFGPAPKTDAALYNEIVSHQITILVGRRGIGKTTFVNRWLTRYSKSLLEREDNPLFWFRISAYRLYTLLNNHGLTKIIEHDEFKNETKVSLYHKLHAAYVFLRYSAENPEFETSERFRKINDYLDKKVHGYNDLSVKCRSYIKDVMGEIGHHPVKDLSSSFMQKIISKHDICIIKEFMNVYNHLCDSIRDKYKGTILVIIDGVDNISWTKKDRRYLEMCKIIRESIKDITSLVPNCFAKLLIVTRPETVPELSPAFEGNGYNEVSEYRIRYPINYGYVALHAPDIFKLFEIKSTALLKSTAFEGERRVCREKFESIRISLSMYQNAKSTEQNEVENYDKVIEDVSRWLMEYPSSLIKNLHDLRVKASELTDITRETLLSVVFDDNVRAFIDSAINCRRGRITSRKLGLGNTDDERRILEYTLLSGKVFVSSQNASRDGRYLKIPRGDVFPNIFWYTGGRHGYIDRWHGLSGYRLLKLVEHKPGLPLGDLIYLAHFSFGYEVDVLVEQAEAFIAFGLIDVQAIGYVESLGLASDSDELKDYTSKVELTEKGKWICDASFAHMDWFSFLALDCPMHSRIILGGSFKIKSYLIPDRNGRLVLNVNYLVAKILNSCALMRHIHFYEDTDLKFFKNRFNDLNRGQSEFVALLSSKKRQRILNLIGSEEYFVSCVKIQDWVYNIFYDDLSNASSGLLENSAEKIGELINDFRGSLAL